MWCFAIVPSDLVLCVVYVYRLTWDSGLEVNYGGASGDGIRGDN